MKIITISEIILENIGFDSCKINKRHGSFYHRNITI